MNQIWYSSKGLTPRNLVSGMSASLVVPVSTKIRLCQPVAQTVDFAQRLEASGSSWITLHARTVSARRRRQGAADLSVVKLLKESLKVPIISNGNTRLYDDIRSNLEYTGADGVMVGETLLGNPWCAVFWSSPARQPSHRHLSIFSSIVPDPADISLEYLGLCQQFPGTATLPVIQTHIKHFLEFQW
jgi:tRNA-dihydrouridine synthase 1